MPLPKKREKNRVSEWIRGHAEGKKEKIHPVICVARSVSEKEMKGREVISPVLSPWLLVDPIPSCPYWFNPLESFILKDKIDTM